jgi:phosphopantothenoylcysteine decarboxylase/phosphopantothenate--cysteine ligase
MLRGSYVALGVSGSVSAHKAIDVASKLAQEGALVDALLTNAATRFVTPLALRSLTSRPVSLDMFDPPGDHAEEHVEVARRAAAMLIAPASASTIARLASGTADDMVCLTALATTAPVLVAPAMDGQMFEHDATQRNLETLRARSYEIIGPDEGRLASGRFGRGRLAETATLVAAVKRAIGRRQGDLVGRRITVTAGGTREPIDPVRFISNYSSGKMGYAIAEAARDRGADVTLVTTASLAAPYGVRVVQVETVAEMQDAVLTAAEGGDALVMAAAVSDYRPAQRAEQKIKKAADSVTLELERTPDILRQAQSVGVKVGFAAETQDLLANAQKKLDEKGLDLIAANDVTAPGAGFAVDTNQVTLLDRSGGREELPLISKYDVGHRILDRVAALLAR